MAQRMNWKWVLAVVMLALVTHPAYHYREFNLLVWRESLDYKLFAGALLVMATIMAVRYFVQLRFEWSEWWLGTLFKKEAPRESLVEEPMMLHPLWCVLYASVLLFTLPAFAAYEELIFREWVVTDMVSVILWSLIFAVAHLLMMVKLKTVVALFLTGFIYGLVFLYEGLAQAVQLHFAFNVIGVSVGALEMQYRRYRQRHQLEPATP